MSELNNEVRFGKVAADMGFITMDQMLKAIEIQVRENIAFGTHRKNRSDFTRRGAYHQCADR